MAATYNYEWSQGEDLPIYLVYKSGPPGETTPVDLTAYAFRMDIVAPDGRALVVLNDKAITDTDPYTSGDQSDNQFEVTMGTEGQVNIWLSRALTLPGGHFYPYLTANPPTRNFAYDMFLRDANNKQRKIMGGTITIERSVTRWV